MHERASSSDEEEISDTNEDKRSTHSEEEKYREASRRKCIDSEQ